MLMAASTYLNSAPLVYSFVKGSRRERFTFIGDAAPSRCAQMLAAGECEIALIPVIEFQRLPGLRIIPEIAVASKNRVRSVLLVARRPLDEVRTVTLDASSRTSQILVQILFSRRYGNSPRFTERMPNPAVNCQNMLEGSDAALVIGDPAMRLESSAGRLGLRIYDLAEEWNLMTGLPFVFAVWAAREESFKKSMDLVPELIGAKQEGIAHLPQIAAQYAEDLKLPESDLLGYLRDNINYDLDPENLAGLSRYFSLAHETGLIAHHRDLRFVQ
ncbi:MAG TPA: menaquinone biosynthesis protein [Blastocatellia bacterium]|nr:menaquinone biosynthesis protein [Blastocatellia bacterium]